MSQMTGPPETSAPSKIRMPSVDALRGLVMIIMAIDHTRDFFHQGAMSFSPENLARTTTALFLTRWITHICAPVFMFTAGMGAFLWLRPGRTVNQLSAFLWKRGLWLVLLELTLFRIAATFNPFGGLIYLATLWALGWSMVALGLLVRLPVRWLAVLSCAGVALHNLADPIAASRFGSDAWIWNILHQPGFLQPAGFQVLDAYPLVPWIFVMAAGYCFGPIVTLEPARRRAWLLRIGGGLTLGFLAIRALNVYGDPSPWSTKVPGMMVLSFLRTTKYPPSLDFLLMTLGPALLLLSYLDSVNFRRTNPLIVFGRVPLFYFLAHFYVLHLLEFPLAYLRYGRIDFLFNLIPSMGGDAKLYPADFGYPLWVVYAIWAGVVAVLYPVCLWFSRVKERRNDWWLGYM